VTFDGKLGRFDKTCAYLLASDFVGRNFSVALELGSDGSPGESEFLSVTDGKNTISIGYGQVLKCNFYNTSLTIHQDWNNGLIVELGLREQPSVRGVPSSNAGGWFQAEPGRGLVHRVQ